MLWATYVKLWCEQCRSQLVPCTPPAGVPYEPGYDGFVELSKQIMSGRNSKQQQQAVSGVLGALLPPNAPTTFRKVFPFKQVGACTDACLHLLLQDHVII